MLSDRQKQFYQENGYLVLESVIGEADIARCHEEIERYRDEARGLTASNDRLDLEDSHTPSDPRLRRIKAPFQNSPIFERIIRSEAVLEPVRDLIGPNLRLHGSKLCLTALAPFSGCGHQHSQPNSRLPGHQSSRDSSSLPSRSLVRR